jgi:hypothetical protein
MQEYLCVGPMPCHAFWLLTQGLRGIARRFCEMTLIVRNMQRKIHDAKGKLSPEQYAQLRRDAHFSWAQAILQTWFSGWAIPESGLCYLWPRIPHICAQAALQHYWQLSISSVTLFGEEAPTL